MSVADNLKRVKEQIASAAMRAGRAPSEVSLVAVSKTKPIALIQEAYAAGQIIFGENYVQEAVKKAQDFPEAEWHFIGTLQTNKVKMITGKFSLLHSIDRLKLAEEVAKNASLSGVVQDVLIQIHVGGEESKHGVGLDGAPALIDAILEKPSLRLRGIMSLPPLTESEADARRVFASLKSAFENWRATRFSSEQSSVFNELSLGTSSDFEWAILEGATMVRVGTAIFGERH